jgi:FemAB-related protein (PEP-CTERM system-associated)
MSSAVVATPVSGENYLRILDCRDTDAVRWDAFVDSRAEASMFHLFGWRTVISEALGHRTHYLLAERDGAVCGVLPLVHIKSLLFGNTLSSLAFCAHAGPLAADEEARSALEQAASARAHELGVGALEYRLLAPTVSGRATKLLYETFDKPIEPDPDANMEAIRSKQRNIIRKGIKNGLTCREDSVQRFYSVYSESVRNLGTPVFPRQLFASIQRVFPNAVEILTAELNGQAISSAMNFYFRDRVCPYYWGGTSAARDLKGNDFLAWSIMCRAAERGSRLFDFGRSKQGTGAYQWKENLGFVAHPLYYEYELIRDRDIPNINPLNPKYRFFIEAWKRLPLPVAELAGPWLARSLG